jgi:hypothetical protein
MKKIVLLLMFLLTASIAFAAEPTPGGAFILDTLLPVLLAGLTLAIKYAVMKFAKSKNMEIVLQNEYLIDAGIRKIVGFVEERAANSSKLNNLKLPGSEKMQLAVGMVLKKFPKMTTEEAEERITGVLAAIEGAGATGEKSIE